MSRAGFCISSNRYRFWAWGAALSSLCLLLCASVAGAEERVQLAGIVDVGPEIEEVLVRARAELSAVGFHVISCSIEDTAGLCAAQVATGRLEVSHREGRLLLKAWARGEMAPLAQELDLGERGVSPEVAAIRAVELLRASLLLSLREGTLHAEYGGSVERFTAWGERREEEPSTKRPQAPEPAPVVVAAPVPQESSPAWVWAVGVGPAFSVPGARVPPGWGGEFFVDAAFERFYFGAAFDAALIASSVQRPEGRTDVSSISAVFRLGWSAPCGVKWVCRIGPHLGILQFDLQAHEATLFRGSDARHLTSVFGGDAMIAHYFSKGVGVFLRARAGVAGNAARLELSEPLVLGRPISGISLGVTFR